MKTTQTNRRFLLCVTKKADSYANADWQPINDGIYESDDTPLSVHDLAEHLENFFRYSGEIDAQKQVWSARNAMAFCDLLEIGDWAYSWEEIDSEGNRVHTS